MVFDVHVSGRRSIVFTLLGAATCFMVATLSAGDAAQAVSPGITPNDALPQYAAPFRNGFYSTIAGINSCKDIKICNFCVEHLCVPGFQCSVPVRTVMQPGPAPLVVVILGAEGKAADPFSKQWVNWLSEAGYHVLSFNSTLEADFINASGRGVSGNIQGEAQGVRDIIGTFLQSPMAQGKVTKLAIVGMSYGGLESLLIGKMAAEKQVPYNIDVIKAFSPPCDMMRSAELIDRWWREDRWKYTLVDIYLKVGKHKPVEPGCEIPLSESMMRAGVAASFRVPFADIVERNDSTYCLNLLPKVRTPQDANMRRQYAETFGFTRFMREGSYPFWKDRLGLKDFSEFNAVARLSNLLPGQPPYVETIICDDDPLNRPEDFEALKAGAGNAKLTILSGGGHIGFINNEWVKRKLQGLFK